MIQTDTLLAEWVRDEQMILWTDLEAAIRSANNGRWSMQAGSVARRIVAAAHLVGPTPIGEVPWRLSSSGVYEAVLQAGGVEVEMPNEEDWQDSEALMADYGSRATNAPLLAGTVAAIRDPREQRWIRGEDE